MDEVSSYNQRRWDALGAVRGLLTRPWLELTRELAHQRIEVDGRLGVVAGKTVLCLAGGGGQQGCAFAMLGASVTVVDLSESQLRSEREAAAHFGLSVRTLQADMRDLSGLEAAQFDIVYQPYSINFVPDCRTVFEQVRRIIRRGGRYQLMIANPYTLGMTSRDWDGQAYRLGHKYEQGAQLVLEDEDFFYRGATGDRSSVPRPVEYRQRLGVVLNGLADLGFVLEHVEEELATFEDAPGSFNHLKAYAPPWMTLWLRAG